MGFVDLLSVPVAVAETRDFVAALIIQHKRGHIIRDEIR